MKILRRELQAQQPQTGHCRIEVKRSETFEQSYRYVNACVVVVYVYLLAVYIDTV